MIVSPSCFRRTSMSADDNHEPLIEGVDSRVHRELETPIMSDILRDELERIEGRIAEVRRQELAVDDELAEIQRKKDDLVETRVALEEAAAVIRQRLGRPASSIIVQLS